MSAVYQQQRRQFRFLGGRIQGFDADDGAKCAFVQSNLPLPCETPFIALDRIWYTGFTLSCNRLSHEITIALSKNTCPNAQNLGH